MLILIEPELSGLPRYGVFCHPGLIEVLWRIYGQREGPFVPHSKEIWPLMVAGCLFGGMMNPPGEHECEPPTACFGQLPPKWAPILCDGTFIALGLLSLG